MATPKAMYSHDEFAHRGQEIFDRNIRSVLHADDTGKFVAIDIDSGDYELDRDDFTATERLLARRPNAQIWLLRAGRAATYRIGGRFAPGAME